MYRRQQIAAIILLAAYLPLLLLQSVHVHHDTVHSDDHCVQCTGHIEVEHHHHGECLFCHTFGTDYLGRPTEQLNDVEEQVAIVAIPVAPTIETDSHGMALLRAPPVC